MAGQDPIGSYIVRMYGHVASGKAAFVGVAHDIESGGSYPFKGPGELWSILTAAHMESPSEGESDASGQNSTSSGER